MRNRRAKSGNSKPKSRWFHRPWFTEISVYIGGTDQYFYCLSADTGKERWKFKTSGAITSMALHYQ